MGSGEAQRRGRELLHGSLAGAAFMTVAMGIYFLLAADGQASTSTRTVLDDLVPLDPRAVWPYVSVYFVAPPLLAGVPGPRLWAALRRGVLLLAVTFAIFWIVPTHVERPDPQAWPPSPSRDFLAWVYDLDTPPRNAAPSGHVSLAMRLGWAVWTTRPRPLVVAYVVVVSLSIVVTGQHHVLDLVTGALLGAVVLGVGPRLDGVRGPDVAVPPAPG